MMPKGTPKSNDDLYNVLVKILNILQNGKGIIIKKVVVSNITNPVVNPTINIPDGMSILIKADDGNTGTLTVLSRRDSQDTWPLLAGQFISLRVSDLKDIQIFGDTTGDIVSFMVEER